MRRLVVIPIYVTDCFHNWTPRSSSGSCTQVPDGRLSRTKSVPLEIWTMPRHGPAGRLFHLQEMERMGAWYGTVRFWRYCCLFHTLTTNQAVLIHRPTPWPHPRSYKHEWMKKEKIGLAIQANGLHLPWAPRVRRRSSHTVWYVHTLVLQFPTWSSYRSSDSRSSSPTNPRSHYGQSMPRFFTQVHPQAGQQHEDLARNHLAWVTRLDETTCGQRTYMPCLSARQRLGIRRRIEKQGLWVLWGTKTSYIHSYVCVDLSTSAGLASSIHNLHLSTDQIMTRPAFSNLFQSRIGRISLYKWRG